MQKKLMLTALAILIAVSVPMGAFAVSMESPLATADSIHDTVECCNDCAVEKVWFCIYDVINHINDTGGTLVLIDDVVEKRFIPFNVIEKRFIPFDIAEATFISNRCCNDCVVEETYKWFCLYDVAGHINDTGGILVLLDVIETIFIPFDCKNEIVTMYDYMEISNRWSWSPNCCGIQSFEGESWGRVMAVVGRWYTPEGVFLGHILQCTSHRHRIRAFCSSNGSDLGLSIINYTPGCGQIQLPF